MFLLLAPIHALAQGPDLFAYDPARLEFQCRPLASTPACRRFEVTFASQVPSEYPGNQTVYATLYEPVRPVPVPAVVVLHVLRTAHASLAKSLCERLASRGIAALAVALPYHMQRTPPGFESGELFLRPDPEQVLKTMRQAVVDIRCAVDFLCSRPDIDPHRLGIVGLSLGAVVGLLAAQVEPRFGAVVSVLGAAEPAHVVWRSELLAPVKNPLRAQGWTESRLEAALEPINAAAFPRPQSDCAVLMINGRRDWVIPRSAAAETWKAFGRPDIIWLNSGHFSAFLSRGKLFDEAIRFLGIRFGMRAGPYTPRQLSTMTVKIGLLGSRKLGILPAAVVEVLPLDSRGRVTVDVGATSRGALAAVSCRPINHLSLGIGALLGQGRPQTGLLWMLHANF